MPKWKKGEKVTAKSGVTSTASRSRASEMEAESQSFEVEIQKEEMTLWPETGGMPMDGRKEKIAA